MPNTFSSFCGRSQGQIGIRSGITGSRTSLKDRKHFYHAQGLTFPALRIARAPFPCAFGDRPLTRTPRAPLIGFMVIILLPFGVITALALWPLTTQAPSGFLNIFMGF